MFGFLGGLFGGGGDGGGFNFNLDFGPDDRTVNPDRYPASMMPGFHGGSGAGTIHPDKSQFNAKAQEQSHEFWAPVFEKIQSNYDGFEGGSEFNPLEGLELPGIEVMGDATDGSLKLGGWALSTPESNDYFKFRTNAQPRPGEMPLNFLMEGEDEVPDVFDRFGGGIMDNGTWSREGPNTFFEWEVPEITLDDPPEDAASSSDPNAPPPLAPVSEVERLYQSILGRAPDSQGLEFWRSRGLSGDELEAAFREGAATEMAVNSDLRDLERSSWGLGLRDYRQIEDLDRLYDTMGSDIEGLFPGDASDLILDRWDARLGSRIDDLASQVDAERSRISDFESSLLGASDDLLSRIGALGIGDQEGMSALGREIESLRRDAGRFSSDLPFDLSQEMGASGLGAAEDELRDLMSRRAQEQNRIADARSMFTEQASALSSRLRSGGFGDLAQLQRIRDQADTLRDQVTGFDTELDADFSSLLSTRLPDIDFAYDAALRNRTNEIANMETGLADLMTEGGRIADYDETGIRSMLSNLDSLSRAASAYTGGDRSAALQDSIRQSRNDFSGRLDQLYDRREALPGEARQRLEDLRETEFYNTDQIASAREDLDAFSDTLGRFGVSNNRSLSQALSLLSEEEARLLEDRANAEQAQVSRENAIGGMALPFYGRDGVTAIGEDDYRQLLSFLRSFGNRGEEPYQGYMPFSASQMIRV